MKLIYASGFSKTEKLEWKPVVFNNIVQSFRMIHDAMKEFSIPFEKPESEVRDMNNPNCFQSNLFRFSLTPCFVNID